MSCVRGNCPANSKWFIEKKFPVPTKERIVSELLRNAHASVEDCQYFEADIRSVGVDDNLLKDIQNPDVAKWVLTTLSLDPSLESLNYLCSSLGNMEFAEWLVATKKFAPTPESFLLACYTSTNSSLLRWLSTRVTLSPSDIIKGLTNALPFSRIEVADWLDATFHVMDGINSKPGCAEDMLIELCGLSLLKGLKWFINHLPQPLQWQASVIESAISPLITFKQWDSVLFLLDTFTQYQPQRNPFLFKLFLVGLMENDLKALQRVIQSVGVDSSLLTPEFVGQCLTTYKHPRSKIVKLQQPPLVPASF
ncbi:hypothetical protein Pelo_19382 [Pelomyxa schiedti]|nr:hypothetical protein Pelo_19382 [Pelomyxa schiedti]